MIDCSHEKKQPRIISFVIPCYASEGSVRLVMNEIRDIVSARDGFDYQIVAVNDCSPDGVLEVLKAEATIDDRVIAIDLAKNKGRHNALICGCRYAVGDYIVLVDDDQQCPVNQLWDLMNPILNDSFDITIARYPKKQQAVWKNAGSRVNDAVSTWLLGKDPNLKFSNFAAMKRFVCDEVTKYENPYPYLSGLMLQSTSRVCNVDMEERPRMIGQGHYGFRKSVALWINSLTAFSTKPLRVAMVIGSILSVIGLITGLFIVIRKLIVPTIAMGYSSIMAAILFIGGMIMMMLGLIGEYTGRIYISLNKIPQYTIRAIYGIERDASQTQRGNVTEA